MATVDVMSQTIVSLQNQIAAAEALSATLRSQRDAIIAQIAPLQAQVSSLNAQIATAEGPDTQTARQVLARLTSPSRFGGTPNDPTTQLLQQASTQAQVTLSAQVTPVTLGA